MSHPDGAAAVSWISMLLDDHPGFTHVELTGTNPISPPHQVSVTLARYAENSDDPDADDEYLMLGVARAGETAHQVWQILTGDDASLWASVSVDRNGDLLPDPHGQDDPLDPHSQDDEDVVRGEDRPD